MDREPEELQFLGLYGIYREAYKVIFLCRKIFSQIASVLILPLALIFLAHIQISEILFSKINQGEESLEHTRLSSPTYNKIQAQISSELTINRLFNDAYLLLVLILSLLSTSAIVYTIACVYTAKEITFKSVISVVPKVWKRLLVTFLWNFLIMLGYNVISIAVIISCAVLLAQTSTFVFILFFLPIFYLVGFVYINVIWCLASVVSVLEDMYGIQAMIKSKALIKAFQKLVVFAHGGSLGMVLNRVSYGLVCLLLLAMLIHYALVVQTVGYFVCKSYHHENIDKSSLADHLEVYLGEYVPLKSKDLQLEQFYA